MKDRAIVFLAYICWALFLTGATGHLANIDQVFTSTPDSKKFLEYSDYLVGSGDAVSSGVVAIRPFLFPLFLGLHRVVGKTGFVLLQFLLNGLTIVVVASAVYRITRSGAIAAVSTVPLFFNVTFTFLALHALAEPLAMFFVAAFLLAFTEYSLTTKCRFYFLSLFAISLAVCSKPVYLPTLVFMVLTGLVALVKPGGFCHAVRPTVVTTFFLLALTPIAVQLSVSFAINGRPSISNAGNLNFTNRYFPAVVGYVQDGRIGYPGFLSYKEPEAKEAVTQFPSVTEKALYLTGHPWETAIMTHFLLVKMNLQEKSAQVTRPREAVVNGQTAQLFALCSRHINRLFSVGHLLFIPVVALAIKMASKEVRYLIVVTAFLSYTTIILSSLSYWQGDRLIVAALPVWSFLYCVSTWIIVRTCRA